MAKSLAFKRSNQQVVTIDTINNRVDNLGPALASAELTNSFPLRSTNLVAVFKGDPYVAYRDSLNQIQVAKYSGGVWTNQPSAQISTGSGQLTPIGLYADRDRIVVLAYLSNSALLDGVIAKRSLDGTTWDPQVTLLAPTQPTPSQGGHGVAWRNAIFFATAAGLAYYRPSTNTFSAAFDTGSDLGLGVAATASGHFAFWNNSLYFARFDAAPVIYKLDPAFDPAAPPAIPMWTLQAATGIANVGVVSYGPDAGNLLLFVSKQDNLCLLYSGQLGTKLLQATAGSFPAFTDVTASYLPADIIATADLGFALYTDDRRRVNEIQTIIAHDPTASDTTLLTWDGATAMATRTTFLATTLMPANERFGSRRTFTNVQPTCHITASAQPFPGRVSLSYTVRDALSRPVDVFGEYSIDGDQWFPMTQGDGDSGAEQLPSSPAGTSYTFFWDAWVDLDGDYPFMFMRVVARISGV